MTKILSKVFKKSTINVDEVLDKFKNCDLKDYLSIKKKVNEQFGSNDLSDIYQILIFLTDPNDLSSLFWLGIVKTDENENANFDIYHMYNLGRSKSDAIENKNLINFFYDKDSKGYYVIKIDKKMNGFVCICILSSILLLNSKYRPFKLLLKMKFDECIDLRNIFKKSDLNDLSYFSLCLIKFAPVRMSQRLIGLTNKIDFPSFLHRQPPKNWSKPKQCICPKKWF